MIDRSGLAEFLRRRRESLQPEDVGLPRGPRRRTTGLRREEVAELCHLSADYYSRIEQERGPLPSEGLIAAIAQGLHLSLDERDHLFRLAGHHPPARGATSEHIGPGLLRIFDRLTDSAAEIVTELGETLRQTPLAVALTGDLTRFTGPARSLPYRWFTDPATRQLYHPDDHDRMSRVFASAARRLTTVRGPGSKAARLADRLLAESPEFAELWNRHDVSAGPHEIKRYVHPEVGLVELDCQTLHDPEQSHRLLVYTAVPGSESYRKLDRLSTIAARPVSADFH
ncbi:helix-turn-helix transcriptional regulator [Paractinoplanes hotanensis]|uniref:Helix-turn-helix transcriptional regulator n=1 Tax=Paractinoplanes hotanensis TaxID=2906497 RepID=A0ABT0XWE8_9ACTN|nr:helix-turn-helix transcriptional regulator [Actinoplanes hotanensis]MCM4078089.1 helix-turn-helix transcriptional regulator [Actinoplanes hotanensis]